MKAVYKPEDNRSHLTGWWYIEGWRLELLCWDPRGERWPPHCKLAGNRLIHSRIHGWSGCLCCSWAGSHYLQSPQEGSKSPASVVWSHLALSRFRLCCLEEGGGKKEKFCNQLRRNLQKQTFFFKVCSQIKRIFQTWTEKAWSSEDSAYSLIYTGETVFGPKKKKILHPASIGQSLELRYKSGGLEVWRYEKTDTTFQCLITLYVWYQILSECDEKLQCIKDLGLIKALAILHRLLWRLIEPNHARYIIPWNTAKRFPSTCPVRTGGICCYFVISLCRRRHSGETAD